MNSQRHSQRLKALAWANQVRSARRATKEAIHSGRIDAARVISACPAELETMPVVDLIAAQYLWGPRRARELLRRLAITEQRQLGRLTQRQRQLVAQELSERNARRGRRRQPEVASLKRPASRGLLPGVADPAGARA